MLSRLNSNRTNLNYVRPENVSNNKIYSQECQNSKQFELSDIHHNKVFIKSKIAFMGKQPFWPSKDMSLVKKFDRTEEDDPQILSSCCFRRGGGISSSEDFKDVENALNVVLEGKNRPIRMLVNGVARGQEPTSLVAVIKDIQQHKPIEKILDLNLLDKNPYPEPFYTITSAPAYGKSSFEQAQGGNWQLNQELMDYLDKVYKDCSRPKNENDPVNLKTKSFWNKSVESFSKQCPPESYDVITFNNVSQYMSDSNVLDSLENFVKMLKVGGILIKNPDTTNDLTSYIGNERVKVPGYEKMEKLDPGIWRKIKE
jgi:chemotaxis methyl-accepting protein methylase